MLPFHHATRGWEALVAGITITDSDQILIRWMSHSLSEFELEKTLCWWLQERDGEQSLERFLTDQQILQHAPNRPIERLRVGENVSANEWFTVYGLPYLREQIIDVEMPEEMPVTPAAAVKEANPKETHPATNPDISDTQLGPPTIGMTLGRCLLTEQIGRGATGIVFRALHRTLNVPVAIKVLHLQLLAGSPHVAQQIRSEARLLAQLNHPNIVRIWDFEDIDPYPYLVLEYISGMNLGELIQQTGRLHHRQAVALMGKVMEGLAAAAKLGIVHRDVKPTNLLISKSGEVKLADLGMAIVVDLRSESRQRGVAGTVAYMAPEQAIPHAVIDHRADIYALGATFYHALTGELPYSGNTRAEVQQLHAHAPVPDPRDVCADIPAPVAQLVRRMMSKRPQDRFADYQELRQAFHHAEGRPQPVSVSPPPPISPERTAHWGTLRDRWGKPTTDENAAEGGT